MTKNRVGFRRRQGYGGQEESTLQNYKKTAERIRPLCLLFYGSLF
jgi:hypothetical protein